MSLLEIILLGLLLGVVLIIIISKLFPKKANKVKVQKSVLDQPVKQPFLQTLDFTDPNMGSALIALLLALIFALFPEYWFINVATPIYMVLGALLAIFLVPIAFVKYYYLPMKKFVPEKEIFIPARKKHIPLTQEWDENGFFKFVKASAEDIKNLPKSYTIRGLEIYQKINLNTPRNVYKEAFQNISTNFAVTDIQSFRQIIEILNKQKSDYLMKLIIIASVGIAIVLIAFGVFMRLSGKV